MSKIDNPAHAFFANGGSVARFKQLEHENAVLKRQIETLTRALQRHALNAQTEEEKTWH